MLLTIAAIVTTQKVEGQQRYVVRSVGTPRVSASDPLLKSALQRLANDARKLLMQWVDKGDSQSIAPWLYNPTLETHVFKQLLVLRDKTLRMKTLLIVDPHPVLSTILVPLLESLLIQKPHAVPMLSQATTGITAWCEKLRKEDPELSLEGYSTTGDIWIEPVDLNLTVDGAKKKKKAKGIGAILGMANPGGAEALHRVGRCLDNLCPDRCQLFGRDTEVKRLESLLSSNRLQSVLLTGSSSVGKSAILQEVVRRRVAARTPKSRHRQQVWLISPARVISGMSYLGQWEERWLSILKEVRKRDHILYFDDPIGLYSAGITRDSQLCMADVLRSFMAESPVRIVFETTAEGVSILRRRDRSLVDPMVPIRIDPQDEPSSLRTLNEVMIQLESENKCFFHPGLMPELIDHANLLSPHLSLPGKIISLARGLVGDTKPNRSSNMDGLESSELDAVEHGYAVTGNELDRFVEERTGLRLALRNLGHTLSDLRQQLSSWIVGQDRAVDVLARYAQRSLQRLQPNDKPLGVFLFLGPTGVGKTESAKALTRLLFHDESRMIRIDMNEISSASAAESLIGTFDHPDGRLPSAIRRQPNAVLLLDEIEKAHPDAFDYLLQVIGEGRLTDARGRPVDFRNAFIIMTSNLGSTESTQAVGYEKTSKIASETQAAIYLRAAKRFFRPEFLNRIDELVIFDRLARDHMRFIVDHHLMTLKSRDGLSRRRVFLDVKPDTVSSIIDRGYDPALGARAIKRVIEREVAQPLADQLAAIRIDAPVLIQLRNHDGRIHSETFELKIHPTAQTPSTLQPAVQLDELLESSRKELEAMRSQLSRRSPSNQNGQDCQNNQDSQNQNHFPTTTNNWFPGSAWEPSALPAPPVHETKITDDSRGGASNAGRSQAEPGNECSRLDQVRYYAIHGAILEAIDYRKELSEQLQAEREAIRNPIAPIKSTSKQVILRNHRARDPHARLKNAAMAELVLKESLTSPTGSDRHEPVPPTRRLQRLVAMARLMLDSSDMPTAWILRARILNPPGSSIQERRRIPLNGEYPFEFAPEFAFQVLRNLEKAFQGLQYNVEALENQSVLIVEGIGAGAILQRLAGTYQRRLTDIADRLLLFETKSIASSDPKSYEKELDAMNGDHNALPRNEYCGLHGWQTIRGEIGVHVVDYVSGSKVRLSGTADWAGWILDQFIDPP